MAQVQKTEDIVPGLIKAVQNSVNANIKGNARLSDLRQLIASGKGTYKEAAEYALEYGNMVKQAMAANVSSSVLPDGKMYWNIADRLFDKIMREEFNEICNQCEIVQTSLNESTGLNIKAQLPEISEDRIKGMKEYASRADLYDDIKASVENALVTYAQSVADDSVKANADFQASAGLHPRIIRRAAPGCCKWCTDIAGAYDYPDDTPQDVFRRHANCNCTVEYDPGSGKRQNVWTKAWKTIEESDKEFNSKQAEVLSQRKKKEEQDRKLLQSKIDSGEISLTLNHEKQAPHMEATREDGKSYFTISEEEVQELINKYHGTGKVVYNGNNFIELIETDHVIGYSVNSSTKEINKTNCFKIHYSKNRTHAVPRKGRNNE